MGLFKRRAENNGQTVYFVNDMSSTDIMVYAPHGRDFLPINKYYKVYGFVKQENNTNVIQALTIVALKDLNEITNHILECMNASVHYSE